MHGYFRRFVVALSCNEEFVQQEREKNMTSTTTMEKPVEAPSSFYPSLVALEDAVRRDLEILDYPSKRWMRPQERPDGAHVHDVIVIGGGHCGLTAAFALMRERIANILVLDENPVGYEGPWQTYARMPDLRTRKAVTGMELGFSNLTFRAYYEAREGLAAYGELKRISCDEWTGYLIWLRRVLSLPVQNESRVEKITPDGNIFRLDVVHGDRRQTLLARRIVLAWGPLAMGGPYVPDIIRNGLPSTAWRHVYDNFESETFKGKRLIVIGAGASAFDNAGTALEIGAAEVNLLVRRPHIPRLSLIRATDTAGFLGTYADLDDQQRIALMSEVQRNPSPPTIRSLNRVEKWPNFHIHFSAPLVSARMEGAEVVVQTQQGEVRGDEVLLATGFAFSLQKCAPIEGFAGQIACWGDRYSAADGVVPERYRNVPYLGRNYQFTEKTPGAAPFLKHIYDFNQSATLSMGPTGRVSGLKYGVRRLMQGVAGSFMQEDFTRQLALIRDYNDSELDGHPWVEKPTVAK